MTSRKVALTVAFLALAAGGTAACDTATDDDGFDGYDSTTYSDTGSEVVGSDAAPVVDDAPGEIAEPDEVVESGDEVFYCADEQGEIVDEEYCDADDATTTYFLWHSPGYARGLPPGTQLDGGDYISAGDRDARRAFKLPATGKVTNGTIKTNVVGRGSIAAGSSAGGDSAGG